MDPVVYSAAMKGEFDKLADKIGQLDQEQTLYNNTVLHIAAQYGQTEFVEKLLEKMDPSMLSMLLPAQDRKGDTALHFAARQGHLLVIKALIARATELDGAGPENGLNIVKEILTLENEDGDTALHEALRTCNLSPLRRVDLKTPAEPAVQTTTTREMVEETDRDVVSLLVYPQYAYRPNKAGETPLYLAAELHSHQVVAMIIDKLPQSEENAAGPGGRTAMHAAVISNNKESTAILWEWNKDLAGKKDSRGWTPLHYAAESGLADRVKQLLLKSVTLGYQITGEEEDEKNTALHLAARGGHIPVLEELILRCPGCWDIVNAKGQNMLHAGVQSEKPEVVIKFFKQRPSLGNLLNQKDNDGNSPLHLAATDYQVLEYFTDTDFSRLDKVSYNNEHRSVLNILATSGHGSTKKKERMMKRLIEDGVPKAGRRAGAKNKEIIKADTAGQGKPITIKDTAEEEDESNDEMMERMLSSQMLVATLVATATFAVGISMPGGYNGQQGPDQGVALLLKQHAFQAFATTNVLAMIFSTTAMLLYLTIEVVFKRFRRLVDFSFFITGMGCSILSVLLMVLAFITGSFAVLAHSPSLAVAMCIISSIYCVAVFSVLLCPLCILIWI